jgi:hypothetical protein
VTTHKQLVGLLSASEFHWHFYQGVEALNAKLYIPGCISLLAGIEASIRCTLFHLESPGSHYDGNLGEVLSNRLLRKAKNNGLPVELLAFPDEVSFLQKLQSKTPLARIVEIRHNLAHGNIAEYINKELALGQHFFTPECLRKDAHLLRHISVRWCRKLSAFRHSALAPQMLPQLV